MPQNNGFDISRREVLAGLGTIGIASAGAGLGTTAFFSDSEDFTNNSLVAGELDLKVDWTEHYSDWSEDEAEGEDLTVSMEPGDDVPFGFPSAAAPEDQSVFVDDPAQFLANTAIEAFPDIDPDTDSENIDEGDYDGQKIQLQNDSDICDLDADLDEVLSSPYRTGGAVEDGVTIGGPPNAQTTAPGDPLVNIEDVKPGDFGEVTFSFHLCGNPGYIWLDGELVDADENRPNPEPERNDEDEIDPTEYANDEDPMDRSLFDNEGDEQDDPDSTDPNETIQEPVELLDEMKMAVWYDTGPDGVYGANFDTKEDTEGDNYRQPEENFIAAAGSARNVLRALEENMIRLSPTPGMGGSSEGSGGGGSTSFLSGTVNNAIKDSGGNIPNNGDFEAFKANANVDCGQLAAQLPEEEFSDDYYSEPPEWAEEKIKKIEGVDLDTGPVTGGVCEFTIDAIGTNNDGEQSAVTLSSPGPIGAVIVKGGQGGANFYFWGEPVSLDGVEFTTPQGQEISNLKVCCPVLNGGGGTQQGNGECFPNSTTAYVALEWWLPVDHANEIQGDSIAFDVGFYTEQCRHNAGPGGQGGTARTVTTGDGFGKSELSDGEPAWFARSRWGSGDTSGTWELGVGDDSDNLTSSNVTNTQYDWNGAVPFSVSYDGGAQEATITVDGTSVTRAVDESPATGDFVVSVKSDSNIDGSSTSVSGLTLNGSPLPISSLSATTSGGSREVNYLLAEGFDFGDGDTLAGTVELDDNGGSPGEEGLVVDVYVD